MDERDSRQEEGVRRAITTLSQSDPLIKLLQQVKLGRMKPTDAGLRAVTESWLATYQEVLSSSRFTGVARERLNPAPRLEMLIECGILPPDHPGIEAVRSTYDAPGTEVVP